MKILFLTLKPISSNSGHLARLVQVLPELSKEQNVTILCLNKDSDSADSLRQYPNVRFLDYPLKTDGWYLVDKDKIISEITEIVKVISPDICILEMEAWELVRELNISLRKITKFATVMHALPFLVAPINPTGDFVKDIYSYLDTNLDLEVYRRKYIINHYKETESVLKDLCIIACNKTVAHYLNRYFADLSVWQLVPIARIKHKKVANKGDRLLYDFVYMARMESGKGIEYLEDILNQISKCIGRCVNVGVFGRADDIKSEEKLNKLVMDQNKDSYTIDFKGWIDNNMKNQLFPSTGVFLYPSHYDNFPTVVNEALSYGLPVITWDVPFSKINYKNIDSVKRISLYDNKGFAEAAVEALVNRDHLIDTSLSYAKTLPSPKKIAEEDLKMYRAIINSSKHD